MKDRKWLLVIGALVLLSIVLPYAKLSAVHAWYGSFFLWLVVGVALIFANVMLTRSWKDE